IQEERKVGLQTGKVGLLILTYSFLFFIIFFASPTKYQIHFKQSRCQHWVGCVHEFKYDNYNEGMYRIKLL
ncbi:MAG TPA: hypothetical protein PK148_06220, partial [Petrotogaceae bacterium]|nr:hypothetical protein [Petrotogaceae bacterium]